jgi:hypothetical protein
MRALRLYLYICMRLRNHMCTSAVPIHPFVGACICMKRSCNWHVLHVPVCLCKAQSVLCVHYFECIYAYAYILYIYIGAPEAPCIRVFNMNVNLCMHVCTQIECDTSLVSSLHDTNTTRHCKTRNIIKHMVIFFFPEAKVCMRTWCT